MAVLQLKQRDPVPVMKRVQPHRTTKLLTCLNYLHPVVYCWLAGCSHLEDYTGRELSGGGVRLEGGAQQMDGGTGLDKNLLCNFIVLN